MIPTLVVGLGERKERHGTHDSRHEFVAGKGEQVEEAQTGGDAEEIEGREDQEDFDQKPGQRRTGLNPQLLGREVVPRPQQETTDQDVGHERHAGDVQIGRIDVIARSDCFSRIEANGPVLQTGTTSDS